MLAFYRGFKSAGIPGQTYRVPSHQGMPKPAGDVCFSCFASIQHVSVQRLMNVKQSSCPVEEGFL